MTALRHAGSLVLKAKLRQPVPPDHFVRKQRLLDLLDELTHVPITLVLAPPGAGKTTLLADWSSRSATTHAWVTLDAPDADPGPLWTLVTAALEPPQPGPVRGAAELFRSAAPLDVAMRTLLDDLHSVDGPDIALVVDNVHLLDSSAAAGESFVELAQNLPSWLHLLLASRGRPVRSWNRSLLQGAGFS